MSVWKRYLCWVFLLVVILIIMGTWHAAFGAEMARPKAYNEAYLGAVKDGKVLAVLIGMEGCPACKEVANDTKYGEATLRRLPHYVKIMVEDYPDLARNMSRSQNVTCPKLCCFWYRNDKWIVERHTGSDKIRAFVKARLYTKKRPVLPVLRQ